MPRCPGWDDETKHKNLTRMMSTSQLKESALDKEGNMIFKKLEMTNLKTTLAFIVQRSYVKLQEICWEGRFNAAAVIQARVRGSKVRKIVRKVLQEAQKGSEDIILREQRARVRLREARIVAGKCDFVMRRVRIGLGLLCIVTLLWLGIAWLGLRILV